jgi:arsenate reductase
MAHGYLQHFSGEKAAVYSAGVEVHGVNPLAVAVMHEDEIDISSHTSNHIDDYAGIPFDLVITVCDNARERCPWFPTTAQKFHHSFPDPAKATGSPDDILEEFRAVREQIKQYCKEFAGEHL